jgi:hypothetical protein
MTFSYIYLSILEDNKKITVSATSSGITGESMS